MGVKIKTTDDKLGDMLKTAKGLNGITIEVGCHGEHAWLARIHEYGCKITVTPKMRKWFAWKGFPLKKTTTQIVIPERSFLRTGFDKNHEAVLKKVEALMPDVLIGTMSEEKYCKDIGLLLSSKIKDYATDLKNPPNSKVTKELKGSSNPLVDSGDMIEHIEHEVIRR